MPSSLLEQAIIDATALKEAALKSAQQAVLEQHAPEVKKALKTILEQETKPDPTEDPMADLNTDSLPSLGGEATPDISGVPPAAPEGSGPSEAVENLPLAATEGEKLCACPDEEEEIEIDFGELEKQMMSSHGGEEPVEMGMTSPQEPISLKLEEEIELDEDLISALFEQEEVQEELEETLLHAGSTCEEEHPNMSHEDWEEQTNKEERKTEEEAKEEQKNKVYETIRREKTLKESKTRETRLITENKNLKTQSLKLFEENNKIKETVGKLSKHLEETNLINAKLLFTNQALVSASLNERQKQKIVEALSNAGSIDEVKIIYETLKNSVGSTPNKKDPKSLNEAVESKRSLSYPRRDNENTSNPVYNRWAKVAGIKK